MKITFSNFAATAPKFDDEQLADGYAVRSINTRAGRGILEPWKAATPVETLQHTAPVSLFKYLTKWFSWMTPTHAVKVPLKNDPYDYAIITQAGSEPRLTDNTRAETGVGPYPTVTIPLGVPMPDAPTVLSTAVAPDWVEGQALPDPAPLPDEYDTQQVSYAIAYKDAFNRLSALSPASNSAEIKEYDFRSTTEVTINLPSLPPDLQLTNAVTGKTAKVRLYRTNFAGGSSSVFQLVTEVEYSETQIKEVTYSGDLNESPINTNWNPPPNMDTALFPNGPMRKVVVVGSDMLAGHNDKLVCFAEPGAFYAYPPDYYKVFKERIVTIVASGSNLMVLTDMYPYVVQGGHPASMDVTRLAEPVPCSSEQGVTEVAGAVFYVSQTGLWEISGYTPKNVTKAYMTDREWAALDPSTIKLANYDGRVFIDSSAQGITYVYDPSNPNDGLRVISQSATTYAQLEDTNDLVFILPASNIIEQFDNATTFMSLGWTSKTHTFNEPMSMPILKVEANQYPVSVTIEVDKLDNSAAISATRIINSARFVYLPFQGRYLNWRAKVDSVDDTSTLEIRTIQVAQTPLELE